MMPMIATTISSSIRVKPFWLRMMETSVAPRVRDVCDRGAFVRRAPRNSNRDAG
jgi:hypothetical protein